MDSAMDCGQYVGLNVGGKIYRTSRATLTRYPDSFFAAMLDGGIPSAKDEQGNYLIDRDGEIFRHILNFLRSGELRLPDGFNEFDLLESEADFFSLGDLIRAVHRTENIAMDCGQYVGLNVGGKIYRTSRATLTRYPDSFFATMLDGGIPSAKDEQGNYLIDRDGEIFRHILNFLRSGELRLPDGFNEFDLLENEADFFSLGDLIRAIHRTENIGVVDESGSTVYKMSRQSLMREKDSYFAKIVRGQINPLKDSHGNFVVDSKGSKADFKQIMQYLKYGAILSAITPASHHTKNTLYVMADRFGLQFLKDQVQVSMNYQWSARVVYYWHNGPDCCLYFTQTFPPTMRGVCQEYAHIYTDPGLSFEWYAGLVDLRKILQDAPVTRESLITYFSEGFNTRLFQNETLSSDCIKLGFY